MKAADGMQAKIKIILCALTTKNQDTMIWLQYFSGKIRLFRKYLIIFIESKFFENFFLLAVILNTVDLSLYGLLTKPEQVKVLDSINSNLTYVFIVEMAIKIMGYGIIGYILSPLNLFDATIVVVSLIDLFLSSVTTNISAIRAVRILRVLRILRPLHYMKKIIKVFSDNFYSFIYICLILVLLIIIYTLIGTQVYAGNLNNQGTRVRQSFNTFYLSFLSVFQLVSIENWNDIETITLNSGVGAALTIFYLLSLIILGNYVFLNLFLGVLLKGFSENEEDDSDLTEEEKFLKIQKLEKAKKEKESQNEEKKIIRLDSEDWENVLTISSSKVFKSQELFNDVECQDSLWIFPKQSILRTFSYKLAFHPKFEMFILFLILLNSVKLGLDTYLPSNETSDLKTISDDFDIFFNACFIFEAVLKIVALGFFFDSGSYMRNYWNILDFCIVMGSIIDISLQNVNIPYLKVFLLIICYENEIKLIF